ncbi:hypothetical protein A8F94_14430 [Bacillus sp. FJAT-27225]|uniref:RES family NAD+ phosphorylase n=1 Tax=Bacillus sp. FJAT-27225 TaxID=1743144 RepID=UPI00080C251D|nr:RES family NAD+ phosphorylase [Bacillus sp. FJAT-27225]OCA86036.1 hypothetical protein A8F94_14430 [Bacillus sp. FJAT-27225]
MSDFIFVEQMKDTKDIITVAVQMDNHELENLAANKNVIEEGTDILSERISWEEVSNKVRDFISIFIANLNHGPAKNKFNHNTYEAPIERKLAQRQQSLEDFAINQLINGPTNINCKVHIRGTYDRLYTDKKIVHEKTEEYKKIGFILSNYLLWSESKNKTLELINIAYKNELDEFQEYIKKYPSLGSYHNTGKRIIEAITEMHPSTIKKSIYFRSREVNQSRVFEQADLGAPKSEYVKKEGRYNHIGIPVLYLASDKKTCIAEMMEENESKLLWFQEFLVDNVQVLDLTTEPSKSISPKHKLLIAALIYEGVINQDSERDRVWKPEYYIPRFVADVAKMAGKFDGIKFSSNRGQGNNLALFNWEGKVSFNGFPKAGVYTRKDFFDPNTPPWQRDLYQMSCPYCHNQISELMRRCNHCGKPNPYFTMDDDI